MRTDVQDHVEVERECADCGKRFFTFDPLTIICETCVDAEMERYQLTGEAVAHLHGAWA